MKGDRMTVTTKWDRRYTRVAYEVNSWSKDPDSQVGVVLVSPDRREIATGYNGLPAGLDDETVLATLSKSLVYKDLQSEGSIKRHISIHAEANAVVNCHRRPEGWTMYSTRFPCSQCAALLAQAGVTRLVCPPPEPNSRWYLSQLVAHELLVTHLELIWDIMGELR